MLSSISDHLQVLLKKERLFGLCKRQVNLLTGSFTTPAAKSNIIAIVFLGSLIELGLFRSERIWTSFNRTMSILTKIVLPILPASVIPNEIGIRLLRRIRD